MKKTLPSNINIVARQGDAWSRESYLKATSAILAEHPHLDGMLGSYGDAFVGAMRAFEAAGIPMDGLVTMHQSDDNPFLCAWKDAGGVTGPGGGIVAERRPEIVNGRYLVTQPTVVPPGTRVTSGARTARILHTRGARGLRRHDSGGGVPSSSVTNVNLHLPAGANGADVVRQVKRFQRRNGVTG
jgi:hypothetical protein